MGQSIYGQTKGVDRKGVTFTTSGGIIETSSSANSLSAVRTAALTLETAVSTSLAAAVTGSSGAGSMDRNVKTTLSASYSSVTASIF